MLDLNECTQTTKNGIHHRLTDIGIKSVQFHEEDEEIPTFRHGTKQIDNIYCSTYIHKYVKSQGFLPFDEICTSDHRALFIDIDISQYIKIQAKKLLIRHRGISSDIPKNVKAYKEYIHERLQDETLQQQIHLITTKFNDNNLNDQDLVTLNQLDQAFEKIRLEAESNLPQKNVNHPHGQANYIRHTSSHNTGLPIKYSSNMDKTKAHESMPSHPYWKRPSLHPT